MKTPYVDPLIPLYETRDETLTRLSANIGTLTGLMNDAERTGQHYLATMFSRARDANVTQAEGIIALAADCDPSADDRRFLLVPGNRLAGVVRALPRQRPAQILGQLALTV